MKHFDLLISSLDFHPLLRLHGALIRSAVHLPAEAVARLLYGAIAAQLSGRNEAKTLAENVMGVNDSSCHHADRKWVGLIACLRMK
jgi:hypothetical protein